jgi:hypothetical protein
MENYDDDERDIKINFGTLNHGNQFKMGTKESIS